MHDIYIYIHEYIDLIYIYIYILFYIYIYIYILFTSKYGEVSFSSAHQPNSEDTSPCSAKRSICSVELDN